MTTHYIKITPNHFDAVICGEKRNEIRKNDRGYQKGDILYLEEVDYVPDTNNTQLRHTGRVQKALASYVTNAMQKEDIVVISLILLPPDEVQNVPGQPDGAISTTPSAGSKRPNDRNRKVNAKSRSSKKRK